MLTLTRDAAERFIRYDALVEGLREGFRAGATVPKRAIHEVDAAGSVHLLVMPAWREGDLIVVKMMVAAADNSAKGLPASNEFMVVFDATTGTVQAAIDCATLTNMRTAATSALAADYLAPREASCLSILATGQMAPYMAAAHASVRRYSDVRIWGRSVERAEATAEAARRLGVANVRVVPDLEQAIREADVVCAATRATTPIVKGRWLKPGAHVDLVGGYTPVMREADDDTVRYARIVVDNVAAVSEAGDLTQPLADGVISPDQVAGDLGLLTRGEIPGRKDNSERTVFKSVGNGVEDLSAVKLLLEQHRNASAATAAD